MKQAKSIEYIIYDESFSQDDIIKNQEVISHFSKQIGNHVTIYIKGNFKDEKEMVSEQIIVNKIKSYKKNLLSVFQKNIYIYDNGINATFLGYNNKIAFFWIYYKGNIDDLVIFY